jgi:putative restriction endonuclease
MPDLVPALELLYRLNVGVTGSGPARHERPHKPLLLLAVLDALDASEATPERVPWNRALKARFKQRFNVVRAADDACTPELPFFHLRGEGWWEPLREDAAGVRPLAAPPSAGDAAAGAVWARFTGEWAVLVGDTQVRAAMRDAIVARYFPRHRAALGAVPASGAELAPLAEAGVVDLARSAGFRRMVVENYDHQCCACGLRIRIPEMGVSFVDAAHLIPFAESRDDHPTNGVALCKHHHWAMDQRLLAPGPSLSWHVSPRVDPRRSRGEEELWRLRGHALLVPAEPAYAPAPEALRWRLERLVG